MSAPRPPAPYDREKYEGWREERGFQQFSPEFNLILMRRMRDEKLDDLTRYVSWLTLYAGGNFSHWPVDSEGNEKFQRDCVRDTGMTRQRVSDAVRLAAKLGYVILARSGPSGRMIQPDGSKNDAQWNQQLNPELSGRFGQDSPFLRYPDFEAEWLKQHPEKQAERAKGETLISQGKAIVKPIDLQILSDWKKLKQVQAQTQPMSPDQPQPARTDLSETVGQPVRDGGDKMSGNGAQNGAPIIRTSEPLKKSKSSLRSLSSNEPKSKQASTACLLADPVPLAELPDLFPGEIITDRTLIELHTDLEERYPALYFPKRFIDAVQARQTGGKPMRFGALLKREPGSFVEDYFEIERREVKKRITAAETTRRKVDEATEDARIEQDYEQYRLRAIDTAVAERTEPERKELLKQAKERFKTLEPTRWGNLPVDMRDKLAWEDYAPRIVAEGLQLLSLEEFKKGGRVHAA